MLVIHIYPYWQEAKEAFTKAVKLKDEITEIDCTRLKLLRAGDCVQYWAGTNYRLLKGVRPYKFIVHDRYRCYGKVLEVVRERELFAGVNVEYV